MLAGGVAVSSVCYAVLETAVLKAIPYEAPTRLIQMGKTMRLGNGRSGLSRADVELLRNRAHCFEALGYEKDVPGMMTGRAGAQVPVMEAQISPGLIETFRLHPVLGRSFRPEEFGPGASGAVLLSSGFWNTAFSADPSIIGKTMTIDGKDYTVIGVMPKAVRRPVSIADVWIADATPQHGPGDAAASDLNVIARLREGLSLEDAQRELAQLRPVPVPGWERPSDNGAFVATSFADQLVGPAGRILNLLLGACLLIQAVACFNVGQLLLARRMGKARELGIQLALGSSAARLALNVLAETILIAAAAVLVCAAFPVILLRRLDASSLISERWQRDQFALSAARLQDVLIVVQVAASVVLLAGFGLLAKSVYRLSAVSAGFNPEHLSYVMFDRGTMAFPASAADNRARQLGPQVSAAIELPPQNVRA
jgi:putative ABC transport system permease protein